MIWVVIVIYDVVFEVSRDQPMFFVDHVNYDVLSEVIHDRTIFFVVHVDYDVLSKVILDQTLFYEVQVYYVTEIFYVERYLRPLAYSLSVAYRVGRQLTIYYPPELTNWQKSNLTKGKRNGKKLPMERNRFRYLRCRLVSRMPREGWNVYQQSSWSKTETQINNFRSNFILSTKQLEMITDLARSPYCGTLAT